MGMSDSLSNFRRFSRRMSATVHDIPQQHQPTTKTYSTPPSSKFYTPIPTEQYIRLLKLHPGKKTDHLTCTLETTPIEQAIDGYEAISYVWGNPEITVDITCNGFPFSITTNLADALRTFRHRKIPRILWADAICINQSDIKERGHQVKQMGKVFKNARRVLGWLGPDTNRIAKDCFQLIEKTTRYLDQQFLEHNMSPWELPPLVPPYPICVDRKRWDNVISLLYLPWFDRVWIVQEIALAKECDLWWGSQTMSVGYIFELAFWHLRRPGFSSLMGGGLDLASIIATLISRFAHIQATYKTEKSWQQTLPLIQNALLTWQTGAFANVLLAGTRLGASDPLDHVYAFLGNPLARKKNGQLIVDADYHSPMEKVYFKTACALLQEKGEGPWLLSSIWHYDLQDMLDRDAPSWVPRWDENSSWHTAVAHPNYWYKAGGEEESFSAHVRDDKALVIAGCVFDKVMWMSDIIYPKNVDLHTQLWDNEVHMTGEPFVDTLWKGVSTMASIKEDEFISTLALGYPVPSPNGRGHSVNMEIERHYFNSYRRRVRSAFPESPSNKSEDCPEGYEPYTFALRMRYSSNRRMIVTENGRIGLVPGFNTRIGDVCCIFMGATAPFILTPVSTDTYKLVGDCYIHDVMDGEIVEQMDLGRFKREDLVIV